MSKSKNETKDTKEEVTPTPKWRARVPIQIMFEYEGAKEDGEEITNKVLVALQTTSKFGVIKVGGPIIEEVK